MERHTQEVVIADNFYYTCLALFCSPSQTHQNRWLTLACVSAGLAVTFPPNGCFNKNVGHNFEVPAADYNSLAPVEVVLAPKALP